MLSTEPEHVSGSKLSNADAEGQGAKSNKAARKTKAAAAAEAAGARRSGGGNAAAAAGEGALPQRTPGSTRRRPRVALCSRWRAQTESTRQAERPKSPLPKK
jgi:hypothetical protein